MGVGSLLLLLSNCHQSHSSQLLSHCDFCSALGCLSSVGEVEDLSRTSERLHTSPGCHAWLVPGYRLRADGDIGFPGLHPQHEWINVIAGLSASSWVNENKTAHSRNTACLRDHLGDRHLRNDGMVLSLLFPHSVSRKWEPLLLPFS